MGGFSTCGFLSGRRKFLIRSKAVFSRSISLSYFTWKTSFYELLKLAPTEKIWICEDAYLSWRKVVRNHRFLRSESWQISVLCNLRRCLICSSFFKVMTTQKSPHLYPKLIITDLWSKDTHDDIQISLSNLYFPPFFQDQNKKLRITLLLSFPP